MVDLAGLQASYESRLPLLEILAETLNDKVVQALDDVSHVDRVCFRVKSVKSFMKKASKPKYDDPLGQLEDQVAGRVITFFRGDIPVVRDRLVEWFGQVENQVKEPAGPEEFGYESEHFVFVIADHWKPDGWYEHDSMPETFELQIRTLFMHAWAEPQHDLGYKGDLDAITKRELAWIAASAWGADRILDAIAQRHSLK